MNNSAGITANIIQSIIYPIVCSILSVIFIELVGHRPQSLQVIHTNAGP
jgi:hypothetical protein